MALRLSEGLARYGYETVVALDEIEALALIRTERRVSVVVAHERSGLELAREARKLRPRLGIVYTASTPQHIPDGAKVSGAPILRTPYTPHQLAGLIAGLGKRVLDEPAAA
jgi:DNA-binding LytR/AlgR family response regulator